jgi:Zn-dependent peptidase ImmA (M78 family)
MRLPNQLWIKPKVIYEVVYQEQIGDDPKDIGYCDDETKHIYIKLGLDQLDELDTQIHELLHAVCHSYRVKLPHKELDKLATALAKVILLNQKP